MTLSGSQNATLTTDVDGNYAFTGLAQGGTYTVTPTASTFTFTPPSQTFANLQANQVAGFFVARTGTFARYFAEGATGAFFDTFIALFNATGQPTTVTVKFQKDNGQVISKTVPMAGLARATIVPETLPGLEAASFSTVIESTQPIIADRTMRWDDAGYGSHAETSVAQPLTTWYFAEGATTGGFNLFYLIQNPTDAARDGADPVPAAGARRADRQDLHGEREHPPDDLRQRRGSAARRSRDLGGHHLDERRADRRRAGDVPRRRRPALRRRPRKRRGARSVDLVVLRRGRHRTVLQHVPARRQPAATGRVARVPVPAAQRRR